MDHRVIEMNTFNSIQLRIVCLACALMSASGTWGNSNFVTNPYLPYPPSCVRMPTVDIDTAAQLQAVLVKEAVIQLPNLVTFEQVDFILRVYRSACHEAGRSLVWLEYSLTAEQAKKDIRVRLPDAVAYFSNNNGVGFVIQASEPNSWGARGLIDGQLLLTRPYDYGERHIFFTEYANLGRSWWFLMDVETPLLPVWEFRPIPAESYNAQFFLQLRYFENIVLNTVIPATAEVNFPEQPAFPVTGRLSGNWVIENTPDQGIMLAISSLVKKPEPNQTGFVEPYFDYPAREMVLFYSHYTFDAQGRMLWLTGSAIFTPGAHQLTIPIDEVSQGSFRSSKPAQRRQAGQVTLTANHCNDITMDYDFSALGLGSGRKRLQRLISLETAGYDCRDYAARVEANQ